MPLSSAHPRVSFIVPLHNCLPLTQALVASLHATVPESPGWELILVDDASRDDTPRWLDAIATGNIRAIRNTANEGFAVSCNRGAAAARGEILVFLNNDLLLTPRWIEPMLAVHDRLGARAGAIGNLQIRMSDGSLDHAGIRINTKGKPEHIRDRRGGSPWSLIRGFRSVDAITGACLLVSSRLWNDLRGFDERFVNGCEDVDFCLRLREANKVNAVALKSTVRHHVSSSPGRKLHDEQNTFRLTLKWRDTLGALAARRWCWEYLSRAWTDPREPVGAWQAMGTLAFGLYLRRKPPALALHAMSRVIDHELERWRDLGLSK